jgi:RNA polymerase sigma-70 factor (ECF subfamily)
VSLDDHIRSHGDLPEQGNGGSPDRVLNRKELAEQIRSALDSLPFDQRTALVLREIDGLSYEEIGFSLGIAVGTVKSRLARAREALRAQLRHA